MCLIPNSNQMIDRSDEIASLRAQLQACQKSRDADFNKWKKEIVAYEMAGKEKDATIQQQAADLAQARRQIEMLEAAFLKSESQRLWDLGKSTGKTSFDCPEAREALEAIRGGKA